MEWMEWIVGVELVVCGVVMVLDMLHMAWSNYTDAKFLRDRNARRR